MRLRKISTTSFCTIRRHGLSSGRTDSGLLRIMRRRFNPAGTARGPGLSSASCLAPAALQAETLSELLNGSYRLKRGRQPFSEGKTEKFQWAGILLGNREISSGQAGKFCPRRRGIYTFLIWRRQRKEPARDGQGIEFRDFHRRCSRSPPRDATSMSPAWLALRRGCAAQQSRTAVSR